MQDNNINLENSKRSNLAKLLKKNAKETRFEKEFTDLYSHLKTKLSADVYEIAKRRMNSQKELDMSSSNVLYKNESLRKINTNSSFYDNNSRIISEETFRKDKKTIKSNRLIQREYEIKLKNWKFKNS